MTEFAKLECQITGFGAYGPGFTDWNSFTPYLKGEMDFNEAFTTPKPSIIPSNERRRAPLPVKLAVETSLQAITMAQQEASQVACVFGSGLGDTEITDYLCRALNSELKQISPTKFHNSVHNAAAGYWTISANCTQAANSIAAYQNTFSIALLEAMSQCVWEDVPVLITLFDIPVTEAMQPAVSNDFPFSASMLIEPKKSNENIISARVCQEETPWPKLSSSPLEKIYKSTPAAKIIVLLEKFLNKDNSPTIVPLSSSSSIEFTLD